MRSEATLAAMREGGLRGAAELRAQRDEGRAFARAWKARGGAWVRWREYVRGHCESQGATA